MAEDDLRHRCGVLFDRARQRVRGRPALAELELALSSGQERLAEPMRVAIVGKIKAGKSTMMNALLGEAVVATGSVETTFNVNWLTYGEPALVVHFKDGRRPEARPISDLERLTRRSDANRAELLTIRHLEVRSLNRLLQTFSLIDTPGLASVYADDSANTRDFLALHGAELTDTTTQQASAADAVLFLFSHSLAGADQAVLEDIHGPALGRASPLNSVGVLTRVDAYWPDRENPLEAGQQIAEALVERHPRLRQLFYALRPVCGLLGLGAQSLTSEEFDQLMRLSRLPEELLGRLLSDVRRLCERDVPGVPVPPAQRRKLWQRLGQYGTWLACRALRQGVGGPRELADLLLQASGVGELRRLLVAHFGHRALLIKLSKVLEEVKEACFQVRRTSGTEDQQTTDTIAADIESLELSEHGFAELRILRSFYAGKLRWQHNDLEQLLAVTGEHGTSLAARLGLAADADRAAQSQVAGERMQRWLLRSNDPLTADRSTRDACRVMALSYARLARQLHEAPPEL